jgi:hypothetical protein
VASGQERVVENACMSTVITNHKKYGVPLDRNEQFELIGELLSAKAKITRLAIALADLTDLLQAQFEEIRILKENQYGRVNDRNKE